MSTEEKTRTEVIKALIAVSDALTLLLQERGEAEAPATTTLTLPVITPEAPPPVEKKTRAKKPVITRSPEPEAEPTPAPAPAPVEPPKQMADIKPTKPGKTLADLRAALQDCINKHGMPGAKERLAPFAKISDVPDDKIAEVIDRLAA
jgi:hypothetical protein